MNITLSKHYNIWGYVKPNKTEEPLISNVQDFLKLNFPQKEIVEFEISTKEHRPADFKLQKKYNTKNYITYYIDVYDSKIKTTTTDSILTFCYKELKLLKLHTKDTIYCRVLK